MGLLNDTKIDFTSKTKYGFSISLIFIICGIASLLYKGGPALSYDFTGGNTVQLEFNQKINPSNIRDILIKNNITGAEIIEFKNSNEILIKAPIINGEDTRLLEVLESSIQTNYIVKKFEKQGPKIGSELKTSALQAILGALLLISIYISIRFDRFYAYGSLAAIIHDVLITVGIFSIVNIEISLTIIAAFLTIVGYSLNDTIVVFDRIRELRIKFPKEKINIIINKSLNQCLSRTIVTSFTTLIVVTTLFFWGGEVLKDFAFALIIGVLIGTYSSIFIASPIMKYFDTNNMGKLTK